MVAQSPIPGVEQPPAPILPKHSFLAPFTNTNAFTGMRSVEDWDIGGSAKVHESFVRVTAEKQGSKGWITNRNVFTENEWSLVMELRATGQEPYLFGDGARADAPRTARVRAPSTSPARAGRCQCSGGRAATSARRPAWPEFLPPPG